MLVADVVKSVIGQHRTEIIHLVDPDATVVKNAGNICYKTVCRIFKIVKHRDAGNDLRLSSWEILVERCPVEIVIDDFGCSFTC